MAHFVRFQPCHLDLADEQIEDRATAFAKQMTQRRSLRAFSDRAVPHAVIEQCLRVAGSAPSGANRQPWYFVAVSDRETKRQIRLAAEEEERAFYGGRASDEWLQALGPFGTDANKPFLETAPWLIVIFAESYSLDSSGHRQKSYYVQESVGIATGMLIAAIHTAGLVSLTHTPSPMLFLSQVLGRPSNQRPYLILVVGHPAENALVPDITRKSLDEIATFV